MILFLDKILHTHSQSYCFHCVIALWAFWHCVSTAGPNATSITAAVCPQSAALQSETFIQHQESIQIVCAVFCYREISIAVNRCLSLSLSYKGIRRSYEHFIDSLIIQSFIFWSAHHEASSAAKRGARSDFETNILILRHWNAASNYIIREGNKSFENMTKLKYFGKTK
jgi:hypothetical protein